MRRPSRLLCALVLGTAVALGCGKKPAPEPAPNTPAPGPAAAAPRSGAVPTAPSAAGTGSLWGGAGAVEGNADTIMTTTTGPGQPAAVSLRQCRFNQVEAALAAAKGKVVLVDCWARWCGPCVQSFPKLVEKHQHFAARGLECMSVSIDSGSKQFGPEQVHAFLKDKNATFQNFYLTDYGADRKAFTDRFAYKGGIPHAVLFSRAGVRVWDGHPMDDGLLARIEVELAK